VDIAQALNMTVAGIVVHQSALKEGSFSRSRNMRCSPTDDEFVGEHLS
jgi:hypothetical protein